MMAVRTESIELSTSFIWNFGKCQKLLQLRNLVRHSKTGESRAWCLPCCYSCMLLILVTHEDLGPYLSITFGTSKNVPSLSGAFCRPTSCGSDFRRPSFTSSRIA